IYNNSNVHSEWNCNEADQEFSCEEGQLHTKNLIGRLFGKRKSKEAMLEIPEDSDNTHERLAEPCRTPSTSDNKNLVSSQYHNEESHIDSTTSSERRAPLPHIQQE
ncbi:hypothetical protein, partial [Salmonella sp. s51884]|uniref:hypothetical protein n=1 Tax=Salmonella sp. s51884 TaxID=3159654 RepID=UPI003980FEE1